MMDPVFFNEKTGRWNAWDETWAFTISDEGYVTEEEAKEALERYVEEFL